METEIKERNGKDELSFRYLWVKEQYSKLRKIYSKDEVSNAELKKLLLSSYEKRKNPEGRFYNPITNSNTKMTLEQYLNFFLNSGNVLTGYNALIKNQTKAQSAAINALGYLLASRKAMKKKMMEYKEGTDEYNDYNLKQKTIKILCNSYYGINSMSTSLLYSYVIQNSTTLTGQDYISTAIYTVEAMLANNEQFRDIDDVINFIAEVTSDKYADDIEKYVSPVSAAEVAKKLYENIANKPESIDSVNFVLRKLNQRELDEVYYRNNFHDLISNDYFKKAIDSTVKGNEYVGDPKLLDLLCEFCEHCHISYDRFFNVSQQKRKISTVTDTDSTFVNLGNLIDETADIENNHDDQYEFNLINFFIDFLSVAMKKILAEFTKNEGIPSDYRPVMNLKNEFVYQRLLTTRNKKSYIGWLLSHFGKRLGPDEPHLGVTGLAIRKTTVPPKLRDLFQQWAVDDILTCKKIDLVKVISDYNKIGDTVSESLASGNTEFLIPMSLDNIENYKAPERIEQVVGAMIWNALEPDKKIVPPERVLLIKLIAKDKNCQALQALKEKYPDKYNTIMKEVFTPNSVGIDLSSKGMYVIALPNDVEEIPDYIRPLIDYDAMKSSNMRNANVLLESLGIMCTDDSRTNQNYKSNVIEL